MKLTNILNIKGKIILRTGLHIGAGDTEMHIGGTDNSVIKHPHTMQPYIPGSSLKGKVRSLLELANGKMGKTDGKPLKISDIDNDPLSKNIVKIFGSGGSDTSPDIGPTRVSFSDCRLNEKWAQTVRENNWPFTEVKSENTINRIKGTAEHPRQMERVIADSEFDFNICLKIFDMDNEDDLKNALSIGLKLLENDALGGSGSRGYGKIRFQFDNDSAITRKKLDDTNLFNL